MKTRFFLLLVIFFIRNIGFAQQNEQNLNYEANNRYVGATVTTGAEKPAGSQYLSETYIPGKLSNGSLILFRYNAYNDQIEFKNDNDVSQYLVATPGTRLTTTDKRTVYEYNDYITEKKELKTGYLLLLSNNPNVKIYTSNKIYLQAGKQASGGYAAAKPPTYKKATSQYYIKIKENQIVPLPLKKNDIGKLFSGKETEVAEYIKSNKISLTEEQDLNKLGTYLNTL